MFGQYILQVPPFVTLGLEIRQNQASKKAGRQGRYIPGKTSANKNSLLIS